jgi:hypothetical protein
VKDGCEALNSKLYMPALAFEVTQNRELRVRLLNSPRKLFATLDENKGVLTWETVPSPRAETITLLEHTEDEMQFARAIATKMLNSLLD